MRANAKKWNLSGKLGVTSHSKGALKQREEVRVEEIRIGSTYAYVTSDDPPTFLSIGELDKKFRVAQMKRLAVRCKEVGITYRLLIQKGMGHKYNPAPEVIGEIFSFFDWPPMAGVRHLSMSLNARR